MRYVIGKRGQTISRLHQDGGKPGLKQARRRARAFNLQKPD